MYDVSDSRSFGSRGGWALALLVILLMQSVRVNNDPVGQHCQAAVELL
jgi:hypothetical protein